MELASDVGVPPFLVAGWIADDVRPAPFVALPMPLPLADMTECKLPMTLHQRLWKWPAKVGPINRAGTFPGMTSTPEEIPQTDAGLALPAIAAWPRGDDPIRTAPTYGEQPASIVPLPEQDGFGLRNVWTRAHPTLPMWSPKPVGGFANGSNVRFVIRGTTKDGTGTPLAACTVTAMRTLEMGAPLDPDPVVVAVETSDAAGAYSCQVPQNVPHQLIGYKAGSPDKAAVSVNNVMPEHL
jgi:hypothetical protein